MIRTIHTLCTFLVLSCVASLSGVLWNHYADKNGLLRISEIYERILTARAGSVDVAQRYRAVTTSQEGSIRATSANEE